MIGAWLEGGELTVRDDLPQPAVASGEAVVRVLCGGICGTDLELRRGYRSFTGVPGHEFVGVVESGPADWLGRRVVSEINVTCVVRDGGPPACATCAAGRPAHCGRRQVIGLLGRDGGFAEHVSVPAGNLHAVPERIPDEAAVFAEPLAAAFRILEQVEPAEVDRALVLGPGRLGQLVARVLRGAVPELVVAGRSEAGLARARAAGLEAIGAGAVRASSFDLVVDCTGSPDGFGAARAAVRPNGTIILKSTYSKELTLDVSSVVVDEIRVLGSRCGPFPRALAALEREEIAVQDLVDERIPLRDAGRGFDLAASPGIAKVLLFP